MPSRVWSAAVWNRSIMSAQALGLFSVGVDPPPDRIEPRPYVVIGDASPNTWYRSVWVI